MNPFPLAGAALRRNLAGAAAIVALIAVAGALAIVASAEERAFRAASTGAADRFDLIIGAPGNPTQLLLSTVYLQPGALDLLPETALQQLSAEPGVATVAPVAVTDSYGSHVIVATSVEFAVSPGLIEGRIPANPHEAVVGMDSGVGLGTRFTPSHGAPHENVLEQHTHAFEIVVVGRVRPTGTPWDRAIIVPIETAWAMHDLDSATDKLGPPWPAARVPAIVAHPRTIGDAYRLRAKYRANGNLAIFPAEVLLPLYRLLGDARDLVDWMAFAFQVLVLCAVVLAMLATLAAQRASLGVLRALGAPPRFVFAVVWLQGLTLVASGTILAALAGALLLRVASAAASARTGLHIEAFLGIREWTLLILPLICGSILVALAALFVLRAPVTDLLRDA